MKVCIYVWFVKWYTVSVSTTFYIIKRKARKKTKKKTKRTQHTSSDQAQQRQKIDNTNTHIHDWSLSWLGTGTSVKSGGVKLLLWAHTSLLLKWCGYINVLNIWVKCQTYKWLSSVIVKHTLIFNFIHTCMFNLREADVLFNIVPLKRFDGTKYHVSTVKPASTDTSK